MRMNELRQKSAEELKSMVREKQSRIVELRMLARQDKIKNVKEISAARKDIARMQTVISSLRA